MPVMPCPLVCGEKAEEHRLCAHTAWAAAPALPRGFPLWSTVWKWIQFFLCSVVRVNSDNSQAGLERLGDCVKQAYKQKPNPTLI